MLQATKPYVKQRQCRHTHASAHNCSAMPGSAKAELSINVGAGPACARNVQCNVERLRNAWQRLIGNRLPAQQPTPTTKDGDQDGKTYSASSELPALGPTTRRPDLLTTSPGSDSEGDADAAFEAAQAAAVPPAPPESLRSGGGDVGRVRDRKAPREDESLAESLLDDAASDSGADATVDVPGGSARRASRAAAAGGVPGATSADGASAAPDHASGAASQGADATLDLTASKARGGTALPADTPPRSAALEPEAAAAGPSSSQPGAAPVADAERGTEPRAGGDAATAGMPSADEQGSTPGAAAEVPCAEEHDNAASVAALAGAAVDEAQPPTATTDVPSAPVFSAHPANASVVPPAAASVEAAPAAADAAAAEPHAAQVAAATDAPNATSQGAHSPGIADSAGTAASSEPAPAAAPAVAPQPHSTQAADTVDITGSTVHSAAASAAQSTAASRSKPDKAAPSKRSAQAQRKRAANARSHAPRARKLPQGGGPKPWSPAGIAEQSVDALLWVQTAKGVPHDAPLAEVRKTAQRLWHDVPPRQLRLQAQAAVAACHHLLRCAAPQGTHAALAVLSDVAPAVDRAGDLLRQRLQQHRALRSAAVEALDDWAAHDGAPMDSLQAASQLAHLQHCLGVYSAAFWDAFASTDQVPHDAQAPAPDGLHNLIERPVASVLLAQASAMAHAQQVGDTALANGVERSLAGAPRHRIDTAVATRAPSMVSAELFACLCGYQRVFGLPHLRGQKQPSAVAAVQQVLLRCRELRSALQPWAAAVAYETAVNWGLHSSSSDAFLRSMHGAVRRSVVRPQPRCGSRERLAHAHGLLTRVRRSYGVADKWHEANRQRLSDAFIETDWPPERLPAALYAIVNLKLPMRPRTPLREHIGVAISDGIELATPTTVVAIAQGAATMMEGTRRTNLRKSNVVNRGRMALAAVKALPRVSPAEADTLLWALAQFGVRELGSGPASKKRKFSALASVVAATVQRIAASDDAGTASKALQNLPALFQGPVPDDLQPAVKRWFEAAFRDSPVKHFFLLLRGARSADIKPETFSRQINGRLGQEHAWQGVPPPRVVRLLEELAICRDELTLGRRAKQHAAAAASCARDMLAPRGTAKWAEETLQKACTELSIDFEAQQDLPEGKSEQKQKERRLETVKHRQRAQLEREQIEAALLAV